jgi:hypothetical protein
MPLKGLFSIVLIPLRAPTKVGEHSGLFLPYGVKQAANAQTSLRQAKQCTALTLPYRVKQAAKRQAKQCTALFCPHPLTISN